MVSRIKQFAGLLLKREKTSVDLEFRLQLHLISLIMLLLSFSVVLFVVLGLFSPQQTAKEALELQMERTSQRLEAYFGGTAAEGLHFSRQIAAEIERTLREEEATFADVMDNQKLIAHLETNTYPYVYNALRIADCSGAFIIFDATVNTKHPNALNSRCGIYLKLANINTSKPVNPEVLLARGIHEIGHNNGHIFHNKWELEFDLSHLPFYPMVIENASKNLIDCYYYSRAVEFSGTWEKMILLFVPIIGENGTVYGVCGFEINNIFFKLAQAETGSSHSRLTGLVAQKEGNTISLESSLEFGTQKGYFAGLSDSSLVVTPKDGLYHYRYAGSGGKKGMEFIGLHREISLSPLSDRQKASWVAACLVPREDFDFIVYFSYFKLVMFCVFFFALALLATSYIRKRYNLPILQGLHAVKNGTQYRTNVSEIDDLLDFLANSDTPQDVDITAFYEFKENTKKLTRAEFAVFNLYLEGHSAAEIADKLFVSINTIKSHNKSIYRKLKVSSRKELLVFAQMMKNAE